MHSVSSFLTAHTKMAHLTSWLTFAVLLAGVTGQSYNYETPGYSYEAPSQHSEELLLDPLARMALNIPGGGVPGVDYPILSAVPETWFSCSDYSYSGYFADTAPESRCQVFHMCHSDCLHNAFLCPNGTIFNQQTFVCELWFNVDCAASSARFDLNLAIGKVPEVRKAVIPKSLYETPVQKPEALYKTPVQEPEVLYKTPVQEAEVREVRKPKELHQSSKPLTQLYHTPEVSDEIKEILYESPVQGYVIITPAKTAEHLYHPELLNETPAKEPKQLYETPVEEPDQLYETPIEEPKQLKSTPIEELGYRYEAPVKEPA